jgi:hypothetical protein
MRLITSSNQMKRGDSDRASLALFGLANADRVSSSSELIRKAENYFSDLDIDLFVPGTEPQSSNITELRFGKLTNWESKVLAHANVKIFYFDSHQKSPLIHTQLGTNVLKSIDNILCCNDHFDHKGQIAAFGKEYGMHMTYSLDDAYFEAASRLHFYHNVKRTHKLGVKPAHIVAPVLLEPAFD